MNEEKTMNTTPNFDTDSSAKEVVSLYLDDIIPNRFQPRERFDETALRELAASIKEHGVIQPIIVRRIGEKYEIIAGERRYKASAMAGLTKIPAIIRNLDDKESSKVALLENLQRKNLSAIEEARTYQKILDLDQMTQFELAKTMGKSQPAVANKLRLLTLPDEVQDALLKEKISERHARSLLNINNEHQQIEMLHKIIDNKMTVRDLDKEIRSKNNPLQGLEQESNFVSQKKEIPTDDKPNGINFDSTREPVELNKPTSLDDLLNINQPEEDEEKPTLESVNPITLEDKVEEKTLDLEEETPTFPDEEPKTEETLSETSNDNKEELLDIPVIDKTDELVESLDISDKELSKDAAIKEIETKVEELKSKGLSIDSEGMNFGDTYQIIIRINKSE